MPEIYVHPASMKSAGTAMRTHAPTIIPAGTTLSTGAKAAKASNSGFNTGQACTNLAEQLVSVIDRLKGKVLDHGAGIITCAEAWEAAEAANERLFKRQGP